VGPIHATGAVDEVLSVGALGGLLWVLRPLLLQIHAAWRFERSMAKGYDPVKLAETLRASSGSAPTVEERGGHVRPESAGP
jgi:hypothetical protein